MNEYQNEYHNIGYAYIAVMLWLQRDCIVRYLSFQVVQSSLTMLYLSVSPKMLNYVLFLISRTAHCNRHYLIVGTIIFLHVCHYLGIE